MFLEFPCPQGNSVVANVDFSDQMTILERAENIFQTWIISKLFHDYFDATTAIFRRHWDPNFGDVLEYVRSSTPLIFVASTLAAWALKTLLPAKYLPEPFAIEMEKGAQGVVFLEKDDSEGIAYAKTKRNIFVTHWAPLAQLLQHSRLKLFFTHGGYNSILEVAQSGKPVLLMPFLYDQTRNAMMVQRNGWGHMFEKASLMKGSKQLEKDLRMVLEDPKFEQGAKIYWPQSRSRPMKYFFAMCSLC
ncbi:UDP-glucoronosyl and UDP-glucosyl transferase domain-containing protein [Ditylenchus destructor]|nr:UDP-glucoronosyl and UDP-glucosyl transferase domain-containing protein [Ditylenchus destructor]